MKNRRLYKARAFFLARQALLLAFLLTHAGNAFAAIFTVGTGAGCTHSTIQAAINAANSTVGFDTVRITRSLPYQAQAITIIPSENVNVVGGFLTCTQSATDNIKTVVSGAGLPADPVFRIFPSTGIVVKLRHLTITDGDEEGNGAGGGILFQGNGVLEIIESSITNNSAAYGGGIYARGTGTDAQLIISNGTVISNNTARNSGGGVSITGPIKMTMTAPNSIIAFNRALGQLTDTGYGGGLEVSSEATAYIGTSGFAGLGAIYSNSAINGGGISIISGSGGAANAEVYLFTTDPSQPVAVRGNYASNTGGAAFVRSNRVGSSLSLGQLCASDFRFEDNAARDGSAFYVDSISNNAIQFGGVVRLNNSICARPGAVACASGIACNTIWNNDAVLTDGAPSDGATVRLVASADLYAFQLDMRGNRGGDAIRGSDFGTEILLKDCLLANNEMTRQLVRAESQSGATILGCTLARNLIGSTEVIRSEESLLMRETIIDQPGRLTLSFFGNSSQLSVGDILANDISTLPADPGIISGDPSFIDAANGNYRLRQYSLATDFARSGNDEDRDLDNGLRDQDLPGVSNVFGPRDLGAYERPIDCGAFDTLFCNGFEP